MKTGIQILFVVLLFATANLLSAHPLGNFSVNQFSRIEVARSEIKIHQILDFAEIPTFQAFGVIDADKDGSLSASELETYQTSISSDYLSKLLLQINNDQLQIDILDKKITIGTGEGDLPTLRLEWNLASKLPETQTSGKLLFQNNAYSERIGWREIIVNNAAGAHVYDSSAYSTALSDDLKSYPKDLLSSPLSERSAEFSFTTGPVPENAKPLTGRDGRTAAAVQPDRLAELIAVPAITPAIALFGLLLAFGLGAMHAMSPGHGKTVVGAYLVGSKGTIKHAAFLGLIVTVTHTLGVFALGLITLFASNYILPERLMPFLGFVSGLLVFFIGISLFKDRLFKLLGWTRQVLDDHPHHEHADHDDGLPHSHDGTTHTHGGSTHSHALPDEITWRNLLALGISGGLLPCPSALVLMLSAITLGRVGYGLVLTIAFSFGLAATLTLVGVIFLKIRNIFGKTSFSESPVFKILPVFSSFVIATVGAVLCYNSLV
ncbi:MAG: sulfite exporter TauE/SafE family protein [Pyrinomonadaceae bacterium]